MDECAARCCGGDARQCKQVQGARAAKRRREQHAATWLEIGRGVGRGLGLERRRLGHTRLAFLLCHRRESLGCAAAATPPLQLGGDSRVEVERGGEQHDTNGTCP